MTQARRRFLKVFLATVFLQVFLLFDGLALLIGPSSGREFQNFLLLVVYLPFIAGMAALSGGTGEGSMIWPPFFGVIIGILFYAWIAGIGFEKIKRLRDRNKTTS
jgi:hypothetical protein